MAASKIDSTRLAPTASRVFGEWYFINGVPASLEEAEAFAARDLPHGDYWVPGDFVRKLRTISKIRCRRNITIH